MQAAHGNRNRAERGKQRTGEKKMKEETRGRRKTKDFLGEKKSKKI